MTPDLASYFYVINNKKWRGERKQVIKKPKQHFCQLLSGIASHQVSLCAFRPSCLTNSSFWGTSLALTVNNLGWKIAQGAGRVSIVCVKRNDGRLCETLARSGGSGCPAVCTQLWLTYRRMYLFLFFLLHDHCPITATKACCVQHMHGAQSRALQPCMLWNIWLFFNYQSRISDYPLMWNSAWHMKGDLIRIWLEWI